MRYCYEQFWHKTKFQIDWKERGKPNFKGKAWRVADTKSRDWNMKFTTPINGEPQQKYTKTSRELIMC